MRTIILALLLTACGGLSEDLGYCTDNNQHDPGGELACYADAGVAWCERDGPDYDAASRIQTFTLDTRMAEIAFCYGWCEAGCDRSRSTGETPTLVCRCS